LATAILIYVLPLATFDARVETSPTSPETVCFRPASYVEPIDLQGLFPEKHPLEVELGSGDGSFLVQWAGLNPTINFLGLERLLGRLRKIDRKAQRAGLSNVRLLRLEAAYFTEYLLPDESIAAFHIYFPDPWPKRKHRQNRLINEHFTGVLARKLVKHGLVYLRTDDQDYFAQMTRVFSNDKQFEPGPTPETLASVITDFERSFNAEGIETNRAAFRRIG
jgi:tRNA (guanine-N7-)-methyltransferase